MQGLQSNDFANIEQSINQTNADPTLELTKDEVQKKANTMNNSMYQTEELAA